VITNSEGIATTRLRRLSTGGSGERLVGGSLGPQQPDTESGAYDLLDQALSGRRYSDVKTEAC
jgi:hypothetical protein